MGPLTDIDRASVIEQLEPPIVTDNTGLFQGCQTTAVPSENTGMHLCSGSRLASAGGAREPGSVTEQTLTLRSVIVHSGESLKVRVPVLEPDKDRKKLVPSNTLPAVDIILEGTTKSGCLMEVSPLLYFSADRILNMKFHFTNCEVSKFGAQCPELSGYKTHTSLIQVIRTE